ncbi:MAG: tRNA lysidine(34) synthetase TilS [Clostridiales bacterium]|jgi:tRNA(Ile)-lysidine synthase|nr:tRNA lysidine(34) synthetase TilS [Clostridiales bacterium]
MDDLFESAYRVIEQYGMLPQGSSVVVGFSGGADSTALMHFLWRLSQKRNIFITAAHVNHCLRGEDSQQDEQFVRNWCGQRGIPLCVKQVDLKREAQILGCGLEECGREIRYAFFQQLAGERNAVIATAHTLSDSVETILLHLAQGSGIRGLAGIPPVRENIIRPLIETTREEVEQYCLNHALAYQTDATNFSKEYSRNRIRLEVVPRLKMINPSLEKTLLRTMRTAEEDEAFLSRLAAKALEEAKEQSGYRVQRLRDLPSPIRGRAVKSLAQQAGAGRIETRHIEKLCQLLEESRGGITLPGGIELEIKDGYLRERMEPMALKLWEQPLLPPRKICVQERKLEILRVSKKEYEQRQKFNKKLFNNALDYATITDSILLRNRRPGDRFCQAGRGVTKSLKKLFNEAKLPAEQRNSLCLAANGSQIIWLEGFGAAQGCAVTADTQAVLLILPEECRHES